MPRLLTKRTYLVPVLVLSFAFPAVAIADGGGSQARLGVADAQPVLGALRRPVVSFRHTIHVTVARIERAHRAAIRRQRRERRELYTSLPGGVSRDTLEAIAACESGGDPAAVSADGSYRGKYQFDFGTWASVGGSGDPAAAPEAEQDYRAALLYASSGSSPWPVCG